MYLAIIILPLLASVASGFFGRKIGVSGAQLINTVCIIITTFLSSIVFFEVGFNNIPVSLSVFKWIDSESLNVFWGFTFDSLTASMLIPVLIVSSLVHLYSIGYMSHDPHNQRFFSYLSLFTFMMVILVTANNFLLMFVGWEGVGICSYLLVSFWFTRIAANQSSMSAFLTNRVGDCFLTVGMFVLLWSFGNIDYSTVFSLSCYINENIISITGVCLLIGAMAKSSQVGLHIWLPQAMEGPTPVSALIHAATMVTAGVYLLMRSSPLIEYSSTVLLLCLWIGGITTVFSSLVGLFQQDIKKVIAYSTMSQLGMMVLAVGLSSYNVALFHLVNHAFYKALLFLGAGAVIHAVADNQDFRKYGGLKQILPLTYSVMLIASLSLVAFPFMTGFYSKDFILESAFGQYRFSSTAVYFLAVLGAIFTTLYSIKVLYLTFLANPAGSLHSYKTAHEGDIFMSLPLIFLAIFSIFFGYFTKDVFIGLGTNFYIDNAIYVHPNHEIMLNTEFSVPVIFKLLPLGFTILFSLLALLLSELYYVFIISFKYLKTGYNLFSFFNQRFYIELFYNTYVLNIILKMGGQTTKVLDKGSIELVGPFGLEKSLNILSKNIANLDTGIITSYALYISIGFIAYILIPYLKDYNLILIFIFGLLILVGNLGSLIYFGTSPVKSHGFATNKLESSLFNFKNFLAFFKFYLIPFLANLGTFGLLRLLGINQLHLLDSSYGFLLIACLVFISAFLSNLIVKNLKQTEKYDYKIISYVSMLSVILFFIFYFILSKYFPEFVSMLFSAIFSPFFTDIALARTPAYAGVPLGSGANTDIIKPWKYVLCSMQSGTGSSGNPNPGQGSSSNPNPGQGSSSNPIPGLGFFGEWMGWKHITSYMVSWGKQRSLPGSTLLSPPVYTYHPDGFDYSVWKQHETEYISRVSSSFNENPNENLEKWTDMENRPPVDTKQEAFRRIDEVKEICKKSIGDCNKSLEGVLTSYFYENKKFASQNPFLVVQNEQTRLLIHKNTKFTKQDNESLYLKYLSTRGNKDWSMNLFVKDTVSGAKNTDLEIKKNVLLTRELWKKTNIDPSTGKPFDS